MFRASSCLAMHMFVAEQVSLSHVLCTMPEHADSASTWFNIVVVRAVAMQHSWRDGIF